MDLSLEELADFAKEFVASVPLASSSRAHVVGLRGELGAGKTTFVQMVARELGITESVTSPTFVFVKAYDIQHPAFSRFVHVDAYRLSLSDADTIGWEDYRTDPRNLILVEWPENLAGFPADAAVIAFTVTGEKTRSLYHHVSDR